MKTTSWLIAALAAGVVAIPASNETGHISIIERRGHYGWVSSYAPTDPGCKAKWGGERPKIIGERCIPFSPITDNIGVWWGSSPLNFDALDAFSDNDCKNQVGDTMWRPGGGELGCFSKKGQTWGSVRYHTEGKIVQ